VIESVFLFANQGHGTTAAEAALRSGTKVVGVCSKAPERLTLRNRLGRLRDLPFRDPFANFKHPSKLGPRYFPSRDLEAVRAFLEGNRPDLILTCSFHARVPDSILRLARYAAVNIHPGLLPERGGGTPNRWAIRSGDTHTGVTAHLMTAEWDTGVHVYRRELPIKSGATWGQVEHSLVPLIRETVRYLIETPNGVTPDGGHVGIVLEHGLTPVRPRLQHSYRGEPYAGQTPEECRRVCRALLPKACGFGIERCNGIHCGLL